MATVDAAAVGRLAVRLGLMTPEQVQEGFNQLGRKYTDPELLVRYWESKNYLTPWQTQKLIKGETEGYFLGGYKLLYQISAGTFGRVFRAEDSQTGQVVAIKVLRKRWSDNPHSVELFEREGRLGQSLVHPNIVQIVSVARDVATAQHYMVMEFVEGGNLKDFLEIRKKLKPAEALRLIEDAASGLAYAHSRGMTHQDIKPTNILISSQGVAKLVDFGLAQVKASQGEAPEDTHVERTVDYAGLERATGVKRGDIRSDIYFLGCVLYELLSGRPPLQPTGHAMARMQKARFDKVPPLRPEEVAAPPSVFELVERMMAFDPKQRYQTPAELLEAIRAARNDVASGVARAGPGSVGSSTAAAATKTVFLVEPIERVREGLRLKLKEKGFKVMVAADPARALDRFQDAPYDALIVDAQTTGEPGLMKFREVLSAADADGYPTVGILIVSDKQADWGQRLMPRPGQAVLVRPVTLSQLLGRLCELLELPVTS
jgi:CheY-like chemotaxis protein